MGLFSGGGGQGGLISWTAYRRKEFYVSKMFRRDHEFSSEKNSVVNIGKYNDMKHKTSYAVASNEYH